MVGVNIWAQAGPARWQPVTGPLVAVVLLLLGRWAGLSWEQLGLGRGSVVCRGWCGAAPPSPSSRRGMPSGSRCPPGAGSSSTRGTGSGCLGAPDRAAARRAARRRRLRGGRVPGGAVGFVRRRARRALGAVPPRCSSGCGTCCPRSTGPGQRRRLARRRTRLRAVARDILAGRWPARSSFTALAGVVFGVLRDQSGSLLAPFLLHWATNGLGIVAAAWPGACSRVTHAGGGSVLLEHLPARLLAPAHRGLDPGQLLRGCRQAVDLADEPRQVGPVVVPPAPGRCRAPGRSSCRRGSGRTSSPAASAGAPGCRAGSPRDARLDRRPVRPEPRRARS